MTKTKQNGSIHAMKIISSRKKKKNVGWDFTAMFCKIKRKSLFSREILFVCDHRWLSNLFLFYEHIFPNLIFLSGSCFSLSCIRWPRIWSRWLFLVFFPLEIIGLTPSEESRRAPVEAARPLFPFVKLFCCLDLVSGLLLFRLRFTFFTRFCIVVEVAVASLIFRSEK